MQKTVQLSSSFSKNILRRALFWSFATHISGAFFILLCTATYHGGLVTISRSLKYVILLTSLLQGVVVLSTFQWKVYVDSKPINNPLCSFLSSIAIGSVLSRLYSERYLTINAADGVAHDRKFIFEMSISIFCAAVSIYAFLVDVNKRGDSSVILPISHPKFLDHLRSLIISEFKNWSTTSVFIGISSVLVQKNFSYIYAMIPAYFPIAGICKLNSNLCYPVGDNTVSIFWTVYCSVMSAFILRITLEIAHSLLLVIVTYPLDFSKLDLIEQSSNLLSSGEDSFLSEALAIGGSTLGDETFSWRQHRPSNSNGSIIKSVTNSAVKVEERSRRPLSFIEISGGQMRAIPSWQEALNRQKSSSEELLASVKPSLYGPPVVPFLGIKNRNLTRFSVLCRSLAFQDLSRVSLAKDRVKNLFKATGKWPEIVFSCCRIMDSATLQLQLFVAYAVHEVIEPHLASVVAEAHQTASIVSRVSHQSSHIELMSSLVANGYAVRSSWDGTMHLAATEIIKAGKTMREKTLQGRSYKTISSSAILTALVPLAVSRAMKGVSEVDPDPIPPLLAQTVALAIDASTILLVSALTADSSGTAQHHLVAVMHSLLALELALKSHSDILRSCFSSPKGTVTAAFLISSSNRVRKNASGGLDSRSNSTSASLAVMATAVDAGILRLVKGYRDIIDAYVFPKIYADALKAKIAAHF